MAHEAGIVNGVIRAAELARRTSPDRWLQLPACHRWKMDVREIADRSMSGRGRDMPSWFGVWHGVMTVRACICCTVWSDRNLGQNPGQKKGGCVKASFTRLFCVTAWGVEVGAVGIHCRVPSGLGLTFLGHAVWKLPDNISRGGTQAGYELFCVAAWGVEVGAVGIHCRVPSGLGLTFLGHAVWKLPDNISRGGTQAGCCQRPERDLQALAGCRKDHR